MAPSNIFGSHIPLQQLRCGCPLLVSYVYISACWADKKKICAHTRFQFLSKNYNHGSLEDCFPNSKPVRWLSWLSYLWPCTFPFSWSPCSIHQVRSVALASCALGLRASLSWVMTWHLLYDCNIRALVKQRWSFSGFAAQMWSPLCWITAVAFCCPLGIFIKGFFQGAFTVLLKVDWDCKS